ncbi:nitrate- and nitrite sensing domain-containing protein [Streptomyces tsukubensis]|uniref:histidine kinase n=1 Tax=Streptomyces tsukubensis TaxID=83656 RepID=A0A1V3ZYX1_9ACTN|nr:nitrate- and nitrite sensing domain-containing protein [Streptomyces tsukubensis]OON71609.1 histidine kinase [Streptomyces tsukubensis]QFR92485.1 HAMP domain-containing protein [Streptomyces tsukubensis]
MRFRGKSIRRKIVALLLVPLLSLSAIWVFATVITGREAYQVFGVTEVLDKIGTPVEDVTGLLQQERRSTLVYLADPRASDALAALRRSRTATDEGIARVERNAADKDVRDRMSAPSRNRVDAVTEAFEGIGSLRSAVEEGSVTRVFALDLYNKLVDPCFTFLSDLRALKDVELDKRGRTVVGLARAREFLSREDALVGSALVARRISEDEIQQVSDLTVQRDLLYESNWALMPAQERDRYQNYWKGAQTSPLRSAEYAVSQSEPSGPSAVGAKYWTDSANSVLKGLSERDAEADQRYRDEVNPYATGVILRATLTGALGFLALLFSLYLSVRIGRSLIHDLSRLRQQAHEASGVRLPGVLRRLAAGETVDVDTEAPRLEYEKDEIGQVGQALNTLQHAAVEAAVRQSELRRGVSEVFVNLARRSQVLLHKQLTLLDAMERRTEDTDELADLFRLDHLTTRMRRHAEGLVILSGAAASRQWRKPVQLMDVVRAAVSEVEDYERVEVRRLPRLAVTGPAVADLTHLAAELLENATVFSPPHTAVQVVGEQVANGFTLEIHDRGLGMAPEALLDANLRLAETPEFELSDTDRLGLFVVSRLAQRQNVRVSLQQSPYGGTTAIVFIPDSLLTDAPDTDGAGLPLGSMARDAWPAGSERARGSAIARLAESPLPGLPASVLEGAGEAEGAGRFDTPLDTSDMDDFPGALGDEDSERGGLFRPRRPLAGGPGEHQHARDERESPKDRARPGETPGATGHAPLPRRGTPTLISSHGRRVPGAGPRPGPSPSHTSPAEGPAPRRSEGPAPRRAADSAVPAAESGPGTENGSARVTGPLTPAPAGGLPQRVRQASLARQLRDGPGQRAEREPDRSGNVHMDDRDAEEVRSRMASLQRGWQRGRAENDQEATAATPQDNDHRAPVDRRADDGGPRRGGHREAPHQDDVHPDSTAQRTTSERDGR